MPIKAKWMGRGMYYEQWLRVISTLDVKESAQDRQKWKAIDGDKKYCVLIDLADCTVLPPLSSLKIAAKVHPRGKAHFLVWGTKGWIGGLFASVAKLVSRATGYYIEPVVDQEQAMKIAAGILRGEYDKKFDEVDMLDEDTAKTLAIVNLASQEDTKPIPQSNEFAIKDEVSSGV